MADDTEYTREELYEEAQEKDLEGRSSMTKDELAEALGKTEGSTPKGELTELAKWRRDEYEGGQPADDE
jgi:hypothetical protein